MGELKEGQEGITSQAESQTDKPDANKEYDDAWEEAGKEHTDEPVEKDEVSDKGLPESAPKEETAKKETEDSYEKALKDTKAWATRLAMENAELRRTLEAFKKGDASSDDVKDAQQAVAKTQASLDAVKEKVYEDYPELKDLIDPLLEKSLALEKEVTELKKVKSQVVEQDRQKEALEYFNTFVKPEVLKAHPDFDDILFKAVEGRRTVNEEYFSWAEKQSPAMRFAAMESSDPQDIIMAISAFKKFKASDEAKAIKLQQEREKKQNIVNAMSLRGGGTPIPAGHRKGDPDDYDSAWNEAGEALKRQGIG